MAFMFMSLNQLGQLYELSSVVLDFILFVFTLHQN